MLESLFVKDGKFEETFVRNS